MKKIALLFSMLFVLALSNQLKAQDYNSAIGLRFGSPLSVTYKFFVTDANAIELYAGFRGYSNVYSYFNVGGMYEIHKAFPGVEGLSWYWGGGVSVLFFSYDYLADDSGVGFGINGVLGLDYKFADAPLNLSVDWTPTVRIGGEFDSGFGAGYGALSARYVLK